MRTIEQIILHVAANTLEKIVSNGRSDNWEDSPYYKGLTKEEKKYLSDYIVETYPEDWEYWEDDPMYSKEKTMYNQENIYKYLVNELRKISYYNIF